MVEVPFAAVFLEDLNEPPGEIVLDFNATDDPLRRQQGGRVFHGYSTCSCYLPL